MEPCVECGFDRFLVFAAFEPLDELPQSLPRDYLTAKSQVTYVDYPLVPKMGTAQYVVASVD